MTEAPQLPPLFRGIEAVAGHIDAGYAILTPNRRLSRAVRDADHRRRAGLPAAAWPSLCAMPMLQFWTEHWQRAVTRGQLRPRRLLPAREQCLLWERIIDDDSTVGFSLLNARRAAALCQRADEQLLLWCLDPSGARWDSWFRSGQDSQEFLRWRAAVTRELEALDATTPERAHAELLTLYETAGADATALPPLVHLHCDEVPPLHVALAARAPAMLSIDTADRSAHIAPVRAYADDNAELRAAARWARERATQDPAGRYAVVLQDMHGQRAVFETMLRREFDCLTTNYESLPVNFATGFPLGRSGIVRDALRILALAAGEAGVEDTIALLHSRFIAVGPWPAAAFERQCRRLREVGRERLPVRLLRQLLAPLAAEGRGAGPWDAAIELHSRGLGVGGTRCPSQWLAVHAALLRAWGWGETAGLDSLEFQQRAQWQEALDEFARLDDLLGEISYEAGLQQLSRLLEDRPFQPQTPDRALQVLGPLETTGLDFEGIWLSGMSAGSWPARARPNPYLPLALQRACAMPGADAATEAAAARRRWQQWRGCCTQLTVSYTCLRDDAEQLPSPLLGDCPVEYPPPVDSLDARWRIAGAMHAVEPLYVPLSDDVRGEGRTSSGALEAQVQCPFQAFARYRLGADPQPLPLPGISGAERGMLLHRALHDVFGELPGRNALRGAGEEGRREVVERALEDAQTALAPQRRHALGGALLALEGRRLAGLLCRWLDLEAERPDDFSVEAREEDRELSLGELHLRLRLDRIDRLTDGSRLIIDYKTGRPDALKAWFEDPPRRPQLPLYALADADASGIAYAFLRPDALAWRGIAEHPLLEGIEAAADHGPAAAEDDPAPASLQQLREGWRSSLTALAGDYVAGVNDVAPEPGACRYCARHALCRIADADAEETLDDDTDTAVHG